MREVEFINVVKYFYPFQLKAVLGNWLMNCDVNMDALDLVKEGKIKRFFRYLTCVSQVKWWLKIIDVVLYNRNNSR